MARGGKREGAGRKKGAINKVKAELKAIAGQYTEEAVGILLNIARESESDAARVAAAKEILDRGHGKATQPIAGDDTAPPIRMIERIIVDPADKHG